MTFPQNLSDLNAVVTGANGFIGQRLISLLLENGAKPTVVLRSSHGKSALEKRGVRVVTGGFDASETLVGILSEADVLFNFAYDVRASKGDNLASFQKLLDAAQKANIARIVHASSIVVYDDWPNGNLNENSPISTTSGGPYRQAKIEMETQLEASGLSCAILQPTLVYGPGSALWTNSLLKGFQSGSVILPQDLGTCSAVYVDDVVQCALRAAVTPDLKCERFIVSGKASVPWKDYYEAHQALAGAGDISYRANEALWSRLGPDQRDQSPDRQTPSLAARVSAFGRATIGSRNFEKLVELAGKIKPTPSETYPDRSMMELLTSKGSCDITKAADMLGYLPEFDLKEGAAAIKKNLSR